MDGGAGSAASGPIHWFSIAVQVTRWGNGWTGYMANRSRVPRGVSRLTCVNMWCNSLSSPSPLSWVLEE